MTGAKTICLIKRNIKANVPMGRFRKFRCHIEFLEEENNYQFKKGHMRDYFFSTRLTLRYFCKSQTILLECN